MNYSKQILLVSLCVLSHLLLSQATGAIKGQVLNNDHEPVFGAVVKILQGGLLVGGTNTDTDGKYTYKPLNAGIYDIIVSSMETHTKRMNGIEVNPDQTSYVDLKVTQNELPFVDIIEVYVKPIVDKSYITMKSMDADEFLHIAGDRSNIPGIIASMSSDVQQDENNGDLHVRGSRGNASAYIVDGVRSDQITGVPTLCVENLSVITGGIPAQYGDMTSGVIVVTTKDYFSGIRSKHIRENYQMEKHARIKREKELLVEGEKRKKEIEEELSTEKENLERNIK